MNEGQTVICKHKGQICEAIVLKMYEEDILLKCGEEEILRKYWEVQIYKAKNDSN